MSESKTFRKRFSGGAAKREQHQTKSNDDIEDILKGGDQVEDEERSVGHVQIRNQLNKARRKRAEDEGKDEGKNVPGTQKIWVRTYGCSHNVSDSETMSGLLDAYGYELVSEQSEADLWLVNSCTVKDPSEAVFSNLVKKGKSQGKKIVIAGCVPQGDSQIFPDTSVVGVHSLGRVVEVVEETLRGNVIRLLQTKKRLPSLTLPKIRRNPLVEIVPLSTGCLGSCTYCKTKHARGVLGSYPPDEILKRVEQSIREGVTEIWLSSEDTGAYGRDINETLPKLLNSITGVLDKHADKYPNVMLRVGMTNPPFILDHLDEIAKILSHPRVFSWLHVPVQSGSDKVLKRMNREYTSSEFMRVADFLKARIPEVIIATDIICGFPGESEEDFQDTMRMVQKYQFGIMNISQFYPRPGTPAAKMKRVDTKIVKDRSRRLTRLFESFNPYKNLIGRKSQKVWVSTERSKRSNHIVAHDKYYRKVLIPVDDENVKPGMCVYVDYLDIARFHIVASAPLKLADVKKRRRKSRQLILEKQRISEEARKISSAVVIVFVAILIVFVVRLVLLHYDDNVEKEEADVFV